MNSVESGDDYPNPNAQVALMCARKYLIITRNHRHNAMFIRLFNKEPNLNENLEMTQTFEFEPTLHMCRFRCARGPWPRRACSGTRWWWPWRSSRSTSTASGGAATAGNVLHPGFITKLEKLVTNPWLGEATYISTPTYILLVSNFAILRHFFGIFAPPWRR